jgi:hypothetical protein
MPYSRIAPDTIRPFGGSRPTSDSAVVVLPQPDSPAIPSASPFASRKLTPSTALTVPDSIENSTRRSSTSRSGAPVTARRGSARRDGGTGGGTAGATASRGSLIGGSAGAG